MYRNAGDDRQREQEEVKVTKRDLIGRRIVAVAMRRQWDGVRREWYYDPVLTLDNGKRIWFITQETEIGEYGTKICKG